jgi:hypothetical protein
MIKVKILVKDNGFLQKSLEFQGGRRGVAIDWKGDDFRALAGPEPQIIRREYS